ncbi:bifunctional diguanylate cyclase/phosphodiesterase [Metapseudomonas furukawaii]|uniref:cyclic-guanylate-specific phosphodiesterase n=1 Tax=Metapseudomonas furukawaii TaxID=1149133 RepID=A0AAD1FH44_METFU|nr:EAL domain-containing protein [Pseudomonas furukawaii]ELS25645.1 diguanylate cyclase/phosphodiesterase [Pseudomonas furukawaii]WAG77950.1 EAL domain-containing protein [Pseudomonas furukawaii]BAU76166.1 diguanylate cyclase/phosphodiesterase (GGDEF & EAL domains) with PAS/PAC sensor(s) [Pseudomonas furukawaii]
MPASCVPSEEVEYLNRALRTLSGCNRALLRAEDEAFLFQEICRVVVEEGGYRMAWVGRAEQDEAQTVTPMAHVGLDQDYVNSLQMTWADRERGRGPTGTAIRTGTPTLSRNILTDPKVGPWRENAITHGIASVLSLPLRVDGRVFGALAICAKEPDAFGERELALLSEAADDLAFGLQALRGKAQRRQAERQVETLNRALATRVAVNHAVIHATDETPLLAEICRVLVEECGYRQAWVDYRQSDPTRPYRMMACDAADGICQGWGSGRHDASFHGRLEQNLEAGQPLVMRDLLNTPTAALHQEARELGFAAALVLPLKVDDDLIGMLVIMAEHADAFDDPEVELLLAMANDLAFGIAALRTRARAVEAETTIRRMAFEDTLTGLPNRLRLRELLDDAISVARQDRRPFGLLHLEIARNQEINETLGYREGDRLQVEIATRLTQVVGPERTVARMGECEFAVLMPNGGAEQASQLARQILTALYDPVELSGLFLEARASIGIALYPGHGTAPESLIRRSGSAMEQAKRANAGFALFQGGLDQECAQHLTLMGDLRRAIDRNELLLYYQPKVEIASNRVCGTEALVRWRHPQHGMLPPDEFVRLAENTGLITPLTLWVLDTALGQRYAWHEEGDERPISVNLSAHDLRDPRLLERIQGSFATWGAKPHWIEFELTESALMEDPVASMQTLSALKELDAHLTIDDFGTGYSSLAYLQKLPVDSLKIDQSFVTRMTSNDGSAKIVRSIIELAHNLDLTVVAEGVEDQLTLNQLGQFGCDIVQGYRISQPIPAEQFRDWEVRSTWH